MIAVQHQKLIFSFAAVREGSDRECSLRSRRISCEEGPSMALACMVHAPTGARCLLFRVASAFEAPYWEMG